MTLAISNAELLAQLTADDWVEVKDPTGKTIGIFQANSPRTLIADDPMVHEQGPAPSPSDLTP